MTVSVQAPRGRPTPDGWRRIRAGLARGELLAFPTETFYGVGCDPRQLPAVSRLLVLKGGRHGKALPLIAASGAAARAAVCLQGPDEMALWRCLAAAFWPGPLSLLAQAAPGLAPGVAHVDGTVAVRVSGSRLARRLAAACGGLIVATSANASGQPPPVTANAAAAGLGAGLDLVLDGGPAPGGAASTLVVVAGATGRVLREGAVPAREIREVVAAAVRGGHPGRPAG